MTDAAELSHAIAVEGWKGPGRGDFPPDERLARLAQVGTEVWLDTGTLEEARRLWRREFDGMTTNNTHISQVVKTGAYDDLIRSAARHLRSLAEPPGPEELVMEIGFIINCRNALRLVETFGVKVSVELHPLLAHEIEESVVFGQRYHRVRPTHFLVKVPLTPAGYCIAARLEAHHVPVNFTLGFSARQNYIAAAVSQPHYVNVFLGRLNAVVADNHLGDGRGVGEKTTLAAARALRDLRRERPEATTRLIAASMREASQVVDLAGVEVHTIPPKVAQEFLASDVCATDIESRLDDDPQVEFAGDQAAAQALFSVLWEVDEGIEALVNELLRLDPLTMTDADVVRAAQERGLGLGYGFTADEEAEIAQQGKIPRLARWVADVPVDELMSQAGLQAFAADQRKVDDHIRALIA